MIKAVILDLGGVYFTDGTTTAVKTISKKYNLKKESVEQFLRTSSELGSLYRKGLISADEFWNNAKKLTGIKASNNLLNKLYMESYTPIRGTIGIIRRLKEREIRIYFLSDNVRERVEYLQGKYKFMRYFIGGIFSHEVHMTKRDGKKIFRLALKKTREKPMDVVFVDDKESYVKTAKKIGMRAILFRNPKQLAAELKKLGV